MTTPLRAVPTPTPAPSRVGAVAGRARAHLVGLQDDAGWWKGELQTNVTIDAEDLLMRQFLGIRDAEVTEQTARWIRTRQAPDGTWANSVRPRPHLRQDIGPPRASGGNPTGKAAPTGPNVGSADEQSNRLGRAHGQ
jgi:hypothetical protein